jgi:effector-binding domain-containing protein
MKKLLLTLTFLAILFVVTGLFLPRQVHVERSIAVGRPAATVFTLLNSYRQFNQWSPWARLDPDAQFNWSGPESGVGARLSWMGDPALVGAGWQEITESIPYRRIAMDLDFGAQGQASSYFEIRGDQVGSLVIWGFDTDVTEGTGFFSGLLGRYFGLFFDRWIGKDYEQGLLAFKEFAETLPVEDFSSLEVSLLEVQPLPALLVSASSDSSPEAIAGALAQAYGEIMAFINANGIEVTGQPMAISRGLSSGSYSFDAAIPVGEVRAEPVGRVRLGHSPGGRAALVVHRGSYATTNSSYARLAAWMAAHGFREGAVSWEHYVSDPGETPEDEIITHLYQLLEASDPAVAPGK